MPPGASAPKRDIMLDEVASPGATDKNARGDLLKVYEAAAVLNCSISTIRRLVTQKKLRAYKVGRSVRIAEADLERLLKPTL
jgi:excisionase family DNA binding protein